MIPPKSPKQFAGFAVTLVKILISHLRRPLKTIFSVLLGPSNLSGPRLQPSQPIGKSSTASTGKQKIKKEDKYGNPSLTH
jgi:hypothetical protein